MKFKKNVPAENRIYLKEELKKYKKEMTLTEEELRELEQWVSLGNSPYDNGDYIYTDQGYPMDFVNAMRFQKEQYEWLMSLSDEEREKELQNIRGEYDSVEDTVVSIATEFNSDTDPEEDLPFA